MTVQLTGAPLLPADVEAVARSNTPVAFSDEARRRVTATRRALEATLDAGAVIYGVNTGFGSLSRARVAPGETGDLQRNLLRSHAAGVGDPLPGEVVRGMLLLLAASLARGASGVRPEVIDAVLGLLNAGVTPIVPETGSVGASGDLAPLAHAGLVLIGEGEAELDGQRMSGGDALAKTGLRPIELSAKEGLAIINGTHLMAARFALLWEELRRLMPAAAVAAAMSVDACRGTDSYLDARVYQLRGQPGPARVAALLDGLIAGSEIVASHRADDPRVQDPYSLRCAPIVLGSAVDACVHAGSALQGELGAVTDNPLVFTGDDASGDAACEVVSAGNFHGMPVALPMDTVALALAHTAGISERRVYFMLAAVDPESHLNPYLSPQPGLHSGYMIAQYTAAAACNELVGLAAPASAINIATSAGMEDYNSFGPRAAAKATRSLGLARSVVAIELLCAAQAFEAHRPHRSGEALERAHAVIRSVVPPLDADRPPARDIAAIERLIASGDIAGVIPAGFRADDPWRVI